MSHGRPRPMDGMPSMGIFLRDPRPYLHKFQRKPQKNSERLGRQVRPEIEPSTFRQQALERKTAQLLVVQGQTVSHACLTRDSNPVTLMSIFFWTNAKQDILNVCKKYLTNYICKNTILLLVQIHCIILF